MRKKGLTVLLICASLWSCALAGCSGSGSSSAGTSQKDTQDLVYSAQALDFGNKSFDPANVTALGNTGDAMYAVCEEQDDENPEPKIYVFTDKGKVSSTIAIPADITQNVACAAATDDGFVVVLASYYVDTADTGDTAADTETAAQSESDAGGISGTFSLLYLSDEGEQKWERTLTEDASGRRIDSVDSIQYADGKLYLGTSSGLTELNPDDGTPQAQIYTVSDDDSSFQYFVLENGDIAVLQNTDDGQGFGILDEDAGTISGNVVSVPSGVYMQGVFPGRGDDLYVSGDLGIYKADMDKKSFTQILDFVASDLNATSVTALAALDDTKLAAVLSDYDENTELDLLTKVSSSESRSAQKITVGCYSLDYAVRKEIVAFNKEHSDVQIEIKDYTSYDSDEGTEGLTQLNTDIISGDTPDIMVLDNDMPVDSYIEKGVLLSLDDYLETDSDIKKDDYLTNIFDAFKKDGKIYQIIPAFTLDTVAGKTSDIGDGKNLTLTAALQLAKQKGISNDYLFGLYDRSSLLSAAMSFVGNEYIDPDEKKSTFDSDSFRDLLKFIKDSPDALSDEQNLEDSSTFYRSGKSLLYVSELTSFADYQVITQGMFGEDVTFTGFPSGKNSGVVISPQLRLAISASTKEKDACWEFVKSFLTDDFQTSVEENYACWPVSGKALDALGEAAKKNPSYEDENGETVEEPNEYYLGSELIELEPLTDAQVEEVKSLLRSASAPIYYNSNVENIISEETGAFFEGQKSVEEVTDVIQNRVTTYIRENS